jgi:hypothetical protein
MDLARVAFRARLARYDNSKKPGGLTIDRVIDAR